MVTFGRAAKSNSAMVLTAGKPHGLDGKVWRAPFFRPEKVQVVFARREHFWVG